MRLTFAILALSLATTAIAAEDSVFPKQYLEEQEFFAGQWTGTGVAGDDAEKTVFRARWAPGKHCLVLQGVTRRKNQEPVKWSILSGCDIATGEMVDYYFDANGVSCVTRWKTISKTEQVGTEIGIQDGKPYSVECKAVKHGPDAWTFLSKTLDGKDIEVEYKRVKEKTK